MGSGRTAKLHGRLPEEEEGPDRWAPPISRRERGVGGKGAGGLAGPRPRKRRGRGGGVEPKGRGWVREEEKFLPFSFSNKIFQIHFPIEFLSNLTLYF